MIRVVTNKLRALDQGTFVSDGGKGFPPISQTIWKNDKTLWADQMAALANIESLLIEIGLKLGLKEETEEQE